MLKHLSRDRLIAVWVTAVAVVMGVSLIAGAQATLATWGLLILFSLMPAAISLFIWQGTPALSMAELMRTPQEPKAR